MLASNLLISDPFWPGTLWHPPVECSLRGWAGSAAFLFLSWGGRGVAARRVSAVTRALGRVQMMGYWGNWVTAQQGCHHTGCSCLHWPWPVLLCQGICPPWSTVPAPYPTKFVAPVSQGAQAAEALLVWVEAKFPLLLTRERCQHRLPGAPSGFVPSYRCGATLWCCQGHRERECLQSPNPLPGAQPGQGGAAFLQASPASAFGLILALPYPHPHCLGGGRV